MTRNISISGAYVMSNTPPPPHATIDVEIAVTLPPAPLAGHLKGRMRVVRVDRGFSKQKGFAIAGDTFALRPDRGGNEQRRSENRSETSSQSSETPQQDDEVEDDVAGSQVVTIQ